MADEQNQVTTTQDTVVTTTEQTNIEKVKAAIAQLEEAGADLFQEEIAKLSTKLTELEAEAKEEVKETVTEVKTFWQKLEPWQRTTHTILLAVILAKLLGAF